MGLELLHDGLGRELRKDRGPGRAGLGGGLLAGEIVVRLDRLAVRLGQHPRLRRVVRPRERDFLGAGKGDGVGGQHHVHLVIDENLLAGGRRDLGELVPRPIAQDVAGQQLGQACIEAANLPILLVEHREQIRRLGAAEAKRAGLLDLAGPLVRRDGRGVGNGALSDQRVERSRVEGCALCKDRRTGRNGQCDHGGFEDGRNLHCSLVDAFSRQTYSSSWNGQPQVGFARLQLPSCGTLSGRFGAAHSGGWTCALARVLALDVSHKGHPICGGANVGKLAPTSR